MLSAPICDVATMLCTIGSGVPSDWLGYACASRGVSMLYLRLRI